MGIPVKRLATVLIAGAAMAGSCVAMTGIAHATVYYGCGPSLNPNSDTSASSRSDAATASAPNYAYVAVRSGWSNSLQQNEYWTKYYWVSGAQSAPPLHLDWTDDHTHANYNICTSIVGGSGPSVYTYAVNDWGGRDFQGFALVNGAWYGPTWLFY